MTRIRTSPVALAVGLLIAGAARAAMSQDAQSSERLSVSDALVYVGTFTGGRSEGIYAFRLEAASREAPQDVTLVPLGLAAESPNPAFLAVDAKRRLLFAVNEVDDFEGRRAGAISAFAIDPATGKLTLLNQRSSRGPGPCHLEMDRQGRYLFAANYAGGSVVVLPIDDDGQLGEATDFVEHAGSSVDPDRQQSPHAHCVTLDPTNRFVFVCDLGLDQVLAYRFDAAAGTLTPHDPPFTATAPGAGPRHMAFRPDGRFAYVVNELNSTITTYAYDADAGRLTENHTVSTLPASYDGRNSGAEIAVHPSGSYLYVSNRGRDSVSLFAVDRERGTLTYVNEQSTGGRTPRHFGMAPSGECLIIANQNSNSLLACRIDADSGRLKPSNVLAAAPSPACVVFVPPQQSER